MGWQQSARNSVFLLRTHLLRLQSGGFSSTRAVHTPHATMSTDINAMRRNALAIFQSAVDAVLPHQMMQRCLELEGRHLHVGGSSYLLDHNLYVVGIGKAAIGMVRAIEDMLGFHIVTGIASVPFGTLEIMKKAGREDMLPRENSNIKFVEGGKDNLPDENSVKATLEIMDLVSRLKPVDVLLVLISGGGSALLSSPTPPVTLSEKQQVIQLLSRRGATIQELNSVRKRLSMVKGGNLAMLARPSQVLALVLSDVIGDPLDLIASGPTVRNSDSPSLPLDILGKYHLLDVIPESVLRTLRDVEKGPSSDPGDFDHVKNVLVGSNKIAVDHAVKTANALGYDTHVLNTSLCGEASAVGKALATLGAILCDSRRYVTVEGRQSELAAVGDTLGLPQSLLQDLLSKAGVELSPLCVVTAGETTVTVIGSGRGGRNQELSLSAAIEMSSRPFACGEVLLLSAGTDGIDGPTNAAGAFAHRYLVRSAQQQGLVARDFLDNNDAFGFYSLAGDLLVTGHTGTNVMDIQLLLVHWQPHK